MAQPCGLGVADGAFYGPHGSCRCVVLGWVSERRAARRQRGRVAIRSGSRRDFRDAPDDPEEPPSVGPHGFAVASVSAERKPLSRRVGLDGVGWLV